MTVPDRAVIAAGNAMRKLWIDRDLPLAALGDPMDWAQVALEAAAPLIEAAERERILAFARPRTIPAEGTTS